MKAQLKKIWDFTERVFDQWIEDRCPKLGAALSFYMIFSLSPLLVVAVFVAGLIFGDDAAQGEIVYQIEDMVGKEGAVIVQTALKNSRYSADGLTAIIISSVTLLIGSTIVFVELQDSLNQIWKVKSKPGRNLFKIIRDFILGRFQSFAMVIGIGFLLLVSLLLSAVLSALNKYLSDTFLSLPSYVFAITDIVIPLFVIFVFFMVVYKVLPDVSIHWKDVWVGALVTSALFVLGKYLIGLYLGSSTVASTYGAAGSLVIFLLWIYYSAQILFLGAEFTKVYVERIGKGVKTSAKFMRYEESQLEVEGDSTP